VIEKEEKKALKEKRKRFFLPLAAQGSQERGEGGKRGAGPAVWTWPSIGEGEGRGSYS